MTEAEKVRARTAAGKCREAMRFVCGQMACPFQEWNPHELLGALDEAEAHAAELRSFVKSISGAKEESVDRPSSDRRRPISGRELNRLRMIVAHYHDRATQLVGTLVDHPRDIDPNRMLTILREADGYAATVRKLLAAAYGGTDEPKPKANRKSRKGGR
ncbi:MAG: hypothetical protein L6R28_07220 [Planctomycetes bacterium]|nr:hypothetical protein [Planctomycetota bacterium]